VTPEQVVSVAAVVAWGDEVMQDLRFLEAGEARDGTLEEGKGWECRARLGTHTSGFRKLRTPHGQVGWGRLFARGAGASK
jgi:hypothetical protein